MVWSSLRSFVRLMIPEINSTTVISDANLLIIANVVFKEFADLTECLPTYTDFNAVASTQRYNLSTSVPTFMRIRKEGFWWYDSTNTKWLQLEPYTIAKLNNDFPNWMNASAADPMRYWIEGDEIGLDPKPDTSYASGLRLFHFKQSTDISLDTHYPLSGSTTSYPHLTHYDEVYLWGIKYKVLPLVGKGQLGEESKQMFYAKCAMIKKELQYRPDIVPYLKHYNMQGIRSRSGYASGR